MSKFLYKTPGISSKTGDKIVWRILFMIECAHARVWVNNLTMFTVMHLIKRVGTMFLIEMESTMQMHLVCMTYMLQINRRAVSATPALVPLV